MNILAITSHHPPYQSGGYELRVRDILDSLAQRGHNIHVLTNRADKRLTTPAPPSPYPVIRRLHDRRRARFFPKEILFDLLDTALLDREIKRFKPDVIYLGHTYILSKALLPYFASQPLPIIYDEGGAGLVEAWTEHGRWFRFTGDYSTGKPLLDALKPVVIRLVCALSRGRIQPQWQWPKQMQIIFNSELNRSVAVNAGVPVEHSTVIHSGVDTDLFTFKLRTAPGTPLRILTPGRIEHRKGQKDAVELLDHLLKAGLDARLVLAGASWSDGYYEEVAELVKTLALGDKVEILPMLSSTELVQQYHQADICFFPSFFRTGFSRVPLEAMACGCVVITYGNEGSDEVIVDSENGYIINDNKSTEALSIIKSLISEPENLKNLTRTGRRLVETEYSMVRYISKIEQVITTVESEQP